MAGTNQKEIPLEDKICFAKEKINAYTRVGYLVECFMKELEFSSFSTLNATILKPCFSEEADVYHLVCGNVRIYDILDECRAEYNETFTIEFALMDNLDVLISECEPDNSCLTVHNAYLVMDSKETKSFLKKAKKFLKNLLKKNSENKEQERKIPIMLQVYRERERR